MSPLDIAALALFAVCWIFYQPLLTWKSRRGGAINTDMTVIRAAWMRNMARRENRFVDGQILAQTLNSATFFASSNLLLIGGAAGALFNSEAAYRHVSSLEVIQTSRLLFEGQLGLIVLALARGLLDFIWAIRQVNYALAAIGSVPEGLDDAGRDRFGDLVVRLLNPALSSFSAGSRGYYFAVAAAAWLFGPIAFMAATMAAVGLLLWRQLASPSAHAIADLRQALEQHVQAPRPPKD